MTPRIEGRLSLDFSVSGDSGRTRLKVLAARPPLRVIRAFELEHGAALVHLHNVSGGLLGGDHLALNVTVGRDARAQLTTTSATRIYKRRADTGVSMQTTQMAVAENGLLEMLPDPLIPYAHAAYEQRTRIDLADGAGLFWWETVAPGREARGEVFEYDLLALDLQIDTLGRPIAIESVRIEPNLRLLTSATRLANYKYFSTFYVCKIGLPAARWTALEGELSELARSFSRTGEAVWGVGMLTAHGLVIRGLSCDGLEIPKRLFAFWDAAKRALYDHPARLPRKVY